MSEQEIKLELERWKGYSAYEVAVQNGFDGTQQEWLESLSGGSISFSVNGKVMGTDGDIKVYAGDIKMEAGALNTVRDKIIEMAKVTDAITPSDDALDLNGKYIDNALFR